MPLTRTIKFLGQRIEHFFMYRVFSLDDTPHRIALGVACGIFLTWLPCIGLQMIGTVALATLLRGNKIVGLPFVWISNPLTIVPIYAPNYVLGAWIMGRTPGDGWKTLSAIPEGAGWWGRVTAWFANMTPIFWELWIGSFVVATVLAILSYFIIRRLTVTYRKKLRAWQEKHGYKHPSDRSKDDDETTDTPAAADEETPCDA